MKKAASINLDTSGGGGSPNKTGSISSADPFGDLDKFEGKNFVGWVAARSDKKEMLTNALVESLNIPYFRLSQDNYLKLQLTDQDVRFVGSLFGSLLLQVGAIRNLEDAANREFKEEISYGWHKNNRMVEAWAKKSESESERPGAKYTEAEVQQLLLGLRREHKDNIEMLRKEQVRIKKM